MEEKIIEDRLTAEGLGTDTVGGLAEKAAARKARRFELLRRLRAHLRHQREIKAREDPTGSWVFMLMARYALSRAASIEPTPERRAAKRRQLLHKWAQYSRELFANRFR